MDTHAPVVRLAIAVTTLTSAEVVRDFVGVAVGRDMATAIPRRD